MAKKIIIENMEWSEKILSELKNLEVIYEQWDPEEEGSFFTDSYILRNRFSDEQILTALADCEGKSMKNADEKEEICWTLGDLINDDLIGGELKSYSLMDGTTLVYENEEF